MEIIEWFVTYRSVIFCVAAGTLAAFLSTGVRYFLEQRDLSREIDDYLTRRRRAGKVDMDDYILTDHDDPQDSHTV